MVSRDELLSQALEEVKDEEVIQLEKDLISIPSYTIEERELAEFIADFLSDQEIDVEKQEVFFPRNKKSHNESSFNVIGRIPGSGEGPSLMFTGHMDHGPIEGRDAADYTGWKRDPWKPEVDGRIYLWQGISGRERWHLRIPLGRACYQAGRYYSSRRFDLCPGLWAQDT